MNARGEIVYLVDDDFRVRRALADLLVSLGWRAETFALAEDYLSYAKPDLPACLILDVQLPDINGLEFQKQLSQGVHPPIVFITGHGDIPSSVSAMRLGAVDFLTKPVREAALIASVTAAIERDRAQRSARADRSELLRRFETLSQREQTVLPLVVSGFLNKQAAAELGISEITLEIHRRNIMRKMQASSFADLVRMAARLDVPITSPRRSNSAAVPREDPQ